MSATPKTSKRPPAVPAAVADAIRERIRALRGTTSPERLSLDAGLSSAAVRLIESGRSAPTLGTLCALAAAMGCGLADLIPAATTPKKNPRKP